LFMAAVNWGNRVNRIRGWQMCTPSPAA
jgi:hypothetical protein